MELGKLKQLSKMKKTSNTKESGICNICSFEGKMSFEHWPPRSCYNDTKMTIQSYEDIVSGEGSGTESVKGFGRYTLCETCNNYTGKYVEEFKKFIIQGYNYIDGKEMINRHLYPLKLEEIEPLFVLKCIVSGFFSTDYVLKNDPEIVKFVLDKDCESIPEKYRFFLYYYNTKAGRHAGYSARLENGNITGCRDICFMPFGYYMTTGGDCPESTEMAEITYFRDYKCKQKDTIGLTIPYLELKPGTHYLPGEFK